MPAAPAEKLAEELAEEQPAESPPAERPPAERPLVVFNFGADFITIKTVATSPDGYLFLAGGFGRIVEIFGSSRGWRHPITFPDTDYTLSVAFGRHGDLYAATPLSLMHVAPSLAQETVQAFPYSQWMPFSDQGPVLEADFHFPSDGGAPLVVLSRNAVTSVYNLRTNAHVCDVPNEFEATCATKISRDGRHFAVLGWDERLSTRDVFEVIVWLSVFTLGHTPEACRHLGTHFIHECEIPDEVIYGSLAWSHATDDASEVIGVEVEANLYVIRRSDGAVMHSNVDDNIMAVDFEPSGALLFAEALSATSQRVVRRRFSAEDGAPQLQTLFHFVGPKQVTQLVVSADGKSVIVVCGSTVEVHGLS